MKAVDTTLSEALETFPETETLTLSGGCSWHEEYPSVMDDFINGVYSRQNPKVRIIFKDDKPVAWGWVLGYNVQRMDRKTGKRKTFRSLCFMTYVEPDYRRQGLATKIYQWAREISRTQHRRMYVFPHDAKSKCFFGEVDAKNKKHYY
jgi:GNAT superfamily N-acetyltransferase